MRKKIVAGNWKMNLTVSEGVALVTELEKEVGNGVKADEMIVFPPFTHLSAVKSTVGSIKIGAQNCHEKTKGAYTGEVSPTMLSNMGIEYVLIGHSERRAYFNEENALLAQKVTAALKSGLKVIYCCGETLPERTDKRHFEVIKNQLIEGLFHLSVSELQSITIAYEPVWAIGTGQTATADQAQEVHAFIRSLVEEEYNVETAQAISILYGGSCNPTNANELFGKPDVDGGLIGGASLKSADFIKIANAY
jgi:triosephosphate isomerase